MNNNKTKRLNLYLDALNKRGSIFMHIGEPNSTLEDYRKIQEHTKDLNGLTKLKISIAKVYSQGLSDYKEAKSILNEVISQLQERGKEDIFADAISALGEIAFERGNYKDALKYYNRAMKIFKKKNNQPGMANIYNNYGIISKNRGDFDKALKYFKKFLTISKSLSDKKHIESAYGNIGNVFWNKGEFEKALDYFQMDLKIAKEIGYNKGKAIVHSNMGSIYADLHINDKAISHLKSSIKIFQEIGFKKGIEISQGNLGTVYLDNGNIQQAYKCFITSLNISKENNNLGGIAWNYGNLGIIFWREGELEKALEYTNKYKEIYKKLELTIYIVDAYLVLGGILLDIKRYKEALEAILKARSILIRDNRDTYNLARVHSLISQVHLKLGNIKEALDNGKKSLEYAQSSNIINHKVFAYRTLGMANSANYEIAMDYFNKSIDIARKEKMGSELALTLFEKAKLYKNIVQKKKLFQESNIIFEKIGWNLWFERAKKELKLLGNI